jgi:hypothetical protein
MGGGFRRLSNEFLHISFDESASEEPVILQEFKDWARITSNDDDELIPTLLKAARQQIEKYCGISIVTKTIVHHFNNEAGGYELPYGPVQAITATFDQEDEVYAIEYKGIDYPTIDTANSFINVEYTAGYVSVPEDLKLAIKQQTLWLYEHRGDTEIKGMSPVAKLTAKQYRRVTWLA